MNEKVKGTAVLEDVHTAEEFAQRPDIFGSDVREYTVLAAFRFAEKDCATKTEAQEIVGRFRNKKVGE